MPRDFDKDAWSAPEFPSNIRQFELDTHRGIVKTDGTQADSIAALEMVKALTELRRATVPAVAATAPAVPAAVVGGTTLREAINHWETVEKMAMRNKATAEARQETIDNFAEHVGDKRPIAGLTKMDVSSWVSYLRGTRKNTQSTAKTKGSHIKALFDSAQRAGFYPAEKVNPADKAVKFTKGDQADRAETHGWQAFTDQQLKTLFNPENLKLTREIHTRRAMVIALYTGARVGEIAQLRLEGFKTVAGQPVMSFKGETKTDASKRQVPIHPDLIALGLLDWVADQRRRGFTRLFPTVKLDGKSGKGNAISKGMGKLLDRLKIEPRIDVDLALTKELDPKIGMHSFRDTVIQAMQGRTNKERRKAYVGHKHELYEKEQERDRESHDTAYMRAWTPTEIAEVFAGIEWGSWLDFSGLREVLAQTDEEHAKAMQSMQHREEVRARTAKRKAEAEAAEKTKAGARISKRATSSNGDPKRKPA